MKRVKTIHEVIENLRQTKDARQDWWDRVETRISEGDYDSALRMLRDHTDDCDFQEQCAIIGQAISSHWAGPAEVEPLRYDERKIRVSDLVRITNERSKYHSRVMRVRHVDHTGGLMLDTGTEDLLFGKNEVEIWD